MQTLWKRGEFPCFLYARETPKPTEKSPGRRLSGWAFVGTCLKVLVWKPQPADQERKLSFTEAIDDDDDFFKGSETSSKTISCS